jgi:hypothetical protein
VQEKEIRLLGAVVVVVVASQSTPAPLLVGDKVEGNHRGRVISRSRVASAS